MPPPRRVERVLQSEVSAAQSSLQRCIVIYVDDAQWGDTDSAALLLETMMQAIVDAFGDQLRQGLSDVRATLRPGEVPTQKVIGWLFDFARDHRDVFIVAMRERFGPPGPDRGAVHTLLEQLTHDTQRDLTMIGFLPDVDPDYMRRLLEVSVNEVFRHCIEYLEAPHRRKELLATTQELLETLLAGAATRDAAKPPRKRVLR